MSCVGAGQRMCRGVRVVHTHTHTRNETAAHRCWRWRPAPARGGNHGAGCQSMGLLRLLGRPTAGQRVHPCDQAGLARTGGQPACLPLRAYSRLLARSGLSCRGRRRLVLDMISATSSCDRRQQDGERGGGVGALPRPAGARWWWDRLPGATARRCTVQARRSASLGGTRRCNRDRLAPHLNLVGVQRQGEEGPLIWQRRRHRHPARLCWGCARRWAGGGDARGLGLLCAGRPPSLAAPASAGAPAEKLLGDLGLDCRRARPQAPDCVAFGCSFGWCRSRPAALRMAARWSVAHSGRGLAAHTRRPGGCPGRAASHQRRAPLMAAAAGAWAALLLPRSDRSAAAEHLSLAARPPAPQHPRRRPARQFWRCGARRMPCASTSTAPCEPLASSHPARQLLPASARPPALQRMRDPTTHTAPTRLLPACRRGCSCEDESIDEIAAFLGVGDQVAALTNQWVPPRALTRRIGSLPRTSPSAGCCCCAPDRAWTSGCCGAAAA